MLSTNDAVEHSGIGALCLHHGVLIWLLTLRNDSHSLLPQPQLRLRKEQKPTTRLFGKGLGFLPSRPCVWVKDTPVTAVPVPNWPSPAHSVRTNYTNNCWGPPNSFVCPTGYPRLLEQLGASCTSHPAVGALPIRSHKVLGQQYRNDLPCFAI